jgi:hypothetical protein
MVVWKEIEHQFLLGFFVWLDPLRIIQYQTLVVSNYGSLKRNWTHNIVHSNKWWNIPQNVGLNELCIIFQWSLSLSLSLSLFLPDPRQKDKETQYSVPIWLSYQTTNETYKNCCCCLLGHSSNSQKLKINK